MKQKRRVTSVDTEQILAGLALFSGVDGEALRRLLQTAEELNVSRGETIYTPKRFRRCLGVILSGRVRVNKGEMVVSVLCAGGVFGAAALFTDSAEYATTLTAMSDCSLVLIPEQAVEQLLHQQPRFAENYVRYLSGRIQFLSARLDALTAGSAERRLAQYLLSNADEEDRLCISATQLSKRIGAGRATLYRVFEALETDGAIARKGKEIRILSREKLHI